MRNRFTLFLLGGFSAATILCAQSSTYHAPKTAWGDPDLQGIYTSDDLHDVPLERPKEFGTRRFLTEQEIAARAKTVSQLKNTIETGERPKDGFWAKQNGVDAAAVPAQWVEFARKASNLTSLIVDPADGHIPALTEDGKKRQAAQPNYFNLKPASWEDLNTYDRCISRGITGSFFPSIYGNGSQFVQMPGMVAIRYEMIHETRLIPTDGRPHASSKMRSWMGDPVGHWEGDTLVVETTNFIGGKIAVGNAPYSEDLKLIERFTRTAANTIDYEVTIIDPQTFTKPWKVAFPINREPGYQIFEYACHEGNYAMHNRLSAARALDAEEAKAAK
jgi:hypothetical protein